MARGMALVFCCCWKRDKTTTWRRDLFLHIL